MNPNASDIVPVNSLIEIAAKGFSLHMQMKEITHIGFFCRQKYIYFCSPTKSMFNKYNSVSSQFNNHSRQYMWPQISFKISCKKKIQTCLTEPIEHSQQYGYCNWPELEHKSFDRSALHASTDQQGIVSATGTFYYGIMEGEISTLLELFWPLHFTSISIPPAQVWPVVWPQVKIVFVNQASRLGLLLAQIFYSLWSYMWRIPYYSLSCYNL